MEWMTDIIGIGASAVSGGVLGLAGGIFSRFFDWLSAREKIKQDQARYKHELAVLEIETNRDVVVAKEAANAKREVADLEALGKSYDADRATYITGTLMSDLPSWARGLIAGAMAVVDLIRGLTRPGLTLYLCVLTTILFFKVQSLILLSGGVPISQELAKSLIDEIVKTVLFLTATAVSWWFATRAKTAPKE